MSVNRRCDFEVTNLKFARSESLREEVLVQFCALTCTREPHLRVETVRLHSMIREFARTIGCLSGVGIRAILKTSTD